MATTPVSAITCPLCGNMEFARISTLRRHNARYHETRKRANIAREMEVVGGCAATESCEGNGMQNAECRRVGFNEAVRLDNGIGEATIPGVRA